MQSDGFASDGFASDGRLIEGEYTYAAIDEKIGSIPLSQKKHPLPWLIVLGVSFIVLNVLMTALTWLLYKGVGIWGVTVPAGWGFAIINFVWWIGIGHAGTLISAILLLLRQQWRNSINRFAEAMTLFAVMCAGLFPLVHTGRPWVSYWLFPYPNILGVWPQFRSPLVWDVFAVSTYFTVSLVFWFIGLIPDLATMRDMAKPRWLKILFGMFAMGWRGSTAHWQRYETVYLILAGLSTPLVLSVHSVVSLDFAVGIVPGWHSTIFPPYFVAGAIYAGFAMVLTLAIPIRAWYGLQDFITIKHLDWMARVMLGTGLIVFYGYINEAFYSLIYSGNIYEHYMLWNRMTGPYAFFYWLLITCNGIIPQAVWSPKVRQSPFWLFIISLVVGLGMWLERFMIVPVSLTRDFMPSAWRMYYPTLWDYATFFGTLGFFTFMMFLFVRFVPMINIFEIKDLLHRITGYHGDVPTAGAPAPARLTPVEERA